VVVEVVVVLGVVVEVVVVLGVVVEVVVVLVPALPVFAIRHTRRPFTRLQINFPRVCDAVAPTLVHLAPGLGVAA
jgi:hypothetical protein